MSWTKAILITAVAIVVPIALVGTFIINFFFEAKNDIIEAWQRDYAALKAERDSLSASLEDVEDIKEALRDKEDARLAANVGRLIAEGRLEEMTTAFEVKATESVTRWNELQRLKVKVAEPSYLESHLEELRGTKEELGAEVEALRDENQMLEEQRRALVPHLLRVPLAGTGSMEPTLTGRDEVTILKDWGNKIEDIPVGAIIEFWPPPHCHSLWPEGGPILHRVIKNHYDGITRERVIYTKGDNAAPDNCRLVESDIYGYVVEIHKDVNPDKT